MREAQQGARDESSSVFEALSESQTPGVCVSFDTGCLRFIRRASLQQLERALAVLDDGRLKALSQFVHAGDGRILVKDLGEADGYLLGEVHHEGPATGNPEAELLERS